MLWIKISVKHAVLGWHLSAEALAYVIEEFYTTNQNPQYQCYSGRADSSVHFHWPNANRITPAESAKNIIEIKYSL